MATVRDIIERAYRKISVVAEDEPMTADQAETALDALNMMMHGWELVGVNVLHADLALTDTFPLQDKFQEGTVYLLSRRLADSNATAAPETDEFLRQLQAAYMLVDEAEMPYSMIYSPSRGGRRRFLP